MPAKKHRDNQGMTEMFQRARGVCARMALALGRKCLYCGGKVRTADSFFGELCPACRKAIKLRIGGYCPGCGACFALETDEVYLCSACRRSPMPWSSLGFFSTYSGFVRSVITEFKFNGRLPLVTLLGKMLQQGFYQHKMEPADVVVPVPLHPKRLKERGFNQSLEMTRQLVPAIAPRVDFRSLLRVRHTTAQLGLDKKARQNNVLDAFRVRNKALAGKHVLLVDDVMTTGATLAGCTRALLKGGARRVDVLVVARA